MRQTDEQDREGPGDGAIVRAVLAGEVERYGVLVRRYRDRYARYASHLLGSVELAEDALQDAFVRAYERLSQCRDPDNFAGWFFLILRNRCFAERRRLARRSPLLEDLGATLPAPGRTDAALEHAELRRAVQQALLALTAEGARWRRRCFHW